MNKVIFNKYKIMLGELMIAFQCIENDLKLIYIRLYNDDVSKELDFLTKIENNRTTLGYIINTLKRSNLFTEEDYKILDKICNVRNYWVHQGSLNFIYTGANDDFYKSYTILKSDHEKIIKLQRRIESFRLSAYEKEPAKKKEDTLNRSVKRKRIVKKKRYYVKKAKDKVK